MKKLPVRQQNIILGKCIDIMRNFADADFPYELGIYLIYTDKRYIQTARYLITENDLEYLTGKNIKSIKHCYDIELAKMIVENSHPYGFEEKHDIYDYFSAGLTVYQDAIPHKL